MIVLSLLLGTLAQADATVVRADGPGSWGDVELVEEAVIGVLEGPEEFIFGRISAVALGPDERLYVADDRLPPRPMKRS